MWLFVRCVESFSGFSKPNKIIFAHVITLHAVHTVKPTVYSFVVGFVTPLLNWSWFFIFLAAILTVLFLSLSARKLWRKTSLILQEGSNILASACFSSFRWWISSLFSGLSEKFYFWGWEWSLAFIGLLCNQVVPSVDQNIWWFIFLCNILGALLILEDFCIVELTTHPRIVHCYLFSLSITVIRKSEAKEEAHRPYVSSL